MNTIEQDYEQALTLIKQGQLQEARQLLTAYNHPKTNQLLKKLQLSSKLNAKKTRNKAKMKPKAKKVSNPFMLMLAFLGILIVSIGFLSTSSINLEQSQIIPATIPPNVTPYTPIDAFAAIAPLTRHCLETDCDTVTVYQSEPLLLLGVAEGDFVEGSTDWYFVESNDNRFFIHKNSITFRDATPAVPTVDWRQEVQPVYYGNDNNTSSSNSSSSPQSQYSCSGNQYDCSSFRSCGEVYSYFNSCPGDPSQLDGDGDNRPCERMCGH